MIIFPRKTERIRFLPTFLLLFCLVPATPLRAVSVATPPPATAAVPPTFGRTVYRQHAESPFQLYIVANSHRSSVTGANGGKTLSAQADTFRIGQWLIERKMIDLLLPEGFFGREDGLITPLRRAKGLDAATLAEKLADTSHFVNAELLLHRQFGIGLYQVEDRRLYLQTRAFLHAGLRSGVNLAPSFDGDLAYLQERRLAAILQNIPGAVETACRQGHLASSKAMLTIGLAHLPDLIRFLQAGKIQIPASHADGNAFPSFSAPLALRNLGVTIIVPQSLLKDRKIMAMARLDPTPTADR